MTYETRQFILDTLLPYKESQDNCAMEEEQCLYLDPRGKKCAVGKHLIDGIHQNFNGSVKGLIEKYGEDIFTEEAISHNIPVNVWVAMQRYHDSIALDDSPSDVEFIVKKLENLTQFKFPEL